MNSNQSKLNFVQNLIANLKMYYHGQIFRSKHTPYRYFSITGVGQKKVTVLEQRYYIPGYLVDNLTRPLRRESFKMTKRSGLLSYGREYFEPFVPPDLPQSINPDILIGSILSIIGIFIIGVYFIVKI